MIARNSDKKNHSVKEWLNFILDKLNAMVELVETITEKIIPRKLVPAGRLQELTCILNSGIFLLLSFSNALSKPDS